MTQYQQFLNTASPLVTSRSAERGIVVLIPTAKNVEMPVCELTFPVKLPVTFPVISAERALTPKEPPSVRFPLMTVLPETLKLPPTNELLVNCRYT